jgi:hypothetical protein
MGLVSINQFQRWTTTTQTTGHSWCDCCVELNITFLNSRCRDVDSRHVDFVLYPYLSSSSLFFALSKEVLIVLSLL